MKKIDEFNADDRQKLKLQESGVHFLIGEITDENINETVKWLASENLSAGEDRVLTLYINSQGGDLYQALGLIDMIRNSRIPVRTIGYGTVMSSGFLIFVSGTKGERYISPNCGIMCHQMSIFEEAGKYHDIKATRKETDRLGKVMIDLLVQATGLESKTVKSKLLPAHDVYLTAQEAIDIGAADHILIGDE